MSWTLTIHGQPVSTNHAYRDRYVMEGQNRIAQGRSKTTAAKDWQATIRQLATYFGPKHWEIPERTFVRIHFRYFLNPDIDCDNVKKLVIDALFSTREGVYVLNDRWVLTCDISKQKVPQGQQRLELEIGLDEELGLHG